MEVEKQKSPMGGRDLVRRHKGQRRFRSNLGAGSAAEGPAEQGPYPSAVPQQGADLRMNFRSGGQPGEPEA